MKIYKLFFAVFLFIFFSFSSVFWNCTFDPSSSTGWTISSALDGCLNNSALVNLWDANIEGWFADYIKSWTNNIALYLWILAVFAIVYWAFMMTVSAWEDEKINKSKWIIKWWIIWFLAVISASAIINLIIRIIYSL